MPLTGETKAQALGEIKAFQAKLWHQTTGEDADDDDITKASELWLGSLIGLIAPDYNELLPDFSPIPDHNFMTAVIGSWMETWREIRVLHAQLFGLSETTARALVSEILATE